MQFLIRTLGVGTAVGLAIAVSALVATQSVARPLGEPTIDPNESEHHHGSDRSLWSRDRDTVDRSTLRNWTGEDAAERSLAATTDVSFNRPPDDVAEWNRDVIDDFPCWECVRTGRKDLSEQSMSTIPGHSPRSVWPTSSLETTFPCSPLRLASTSCRQDASDRTGKVSTSCERCGTEFEYYPSEKEGLYCSDCVEAGDWRPSPSLTGEENPRWSGGKRVLSCDICGETVERYPSNVNEVVVCSEACRREWLSESFTGDGHPNWKGGGNGAYGAGWNDVRRRALQRDDYQCVRCGATADDIGRNPDVHHIVPVRWFIESDDHTKTDAHFLDNVISLCISCHRKADHGKISKERLRSLIDSGSTASTDGE